MGKRPQGYNLLILLSIFGLTGFGGAIIWSLSQTFFSYQIIFFLIGLLLFLIFSKISLDWISPSWVFLFFISTVLLLLPFFFPPVRGSHRWIAIAGLTIQPSELVKPLLILVISSYIVSSDLGKTWSFLTACFLIIFSSLIVFLQPDLGNAIVILISLFSLVALSPRKPVFFWKLFLGGIIVLPFLWFFLRDYQKTRLLSFFSPQMDPQGASYNSIQAIIALGSGRFFGQGLSRGTQSHLRFLPEAHTDFIFASLVEELGFFGGMIILILYFILLLELLRSLKKISESFSFYVLGGILIQFLIEIFINLGMNLNLLPITGIALPLVSSGGSSMISTLITLGIAQNLIWRERREEITIS